MSKKRSNNPFTTPAVAAEWVTHIEQDCADIYVKEFYPCLQDWLATYAGPVMDIGCGQARASEYCAAHHVYHGIDASQPLIDRAREKYGLATDQVACAEVGCMPFASDSFVCAFSINVFMHIRDLALALTEVARVVTPGGKVLLITSNPHERTLWSSLYYDTREISGGVVGKIDTQRGTLSHNVFYAHTEEEWMRAMQHAGMSFSIRAHFGRYPHTNQYLFVAIEGEVL